MARWSEQWKMCSSDGGCEKLSGLAGFRVASLMAKGLVNELVFSVKSFCSFNSNRAKIKRKKKG